jgi:hypothetical protein
LVRRKPPYKRLIDIAPGPKHITSNKVGEGMRKGKKKQKAMGVREDMAVLNPNAGGIDVGHRRYGYRCHRREMKSQ